MEHYFWGQSQLSTSAFFIDDYWVIFNKEQFHFVDLTEFELNYFIGVCLQYGKLFGTNFNFWIFRIHRPSTFSEPDSQRSNSSILTYNTYFKERTSIPFSLAVISISFSNFNRNPACADHWIKKIIKKGLPRRFIPRIRAQFPLPEMIYQSTNPNIPLFPISVVLNESLSKSIVYRLFYANSHLSLHINSHSGDKNFLSIFDYKNIGALYASDI